MEWNDSAIVLQTGKFREADLWLRIFSKKRGLITVFAFGGSRSRRRFCGCLDILNTIACRVKSSANGQYLALVESSLLHGPQKLRHDLSRLGMFTNCIRFLEVLGINQEGSQISYALLQQMVTLFEGQNTPHFLIPIFFRLRIACEQGFAPAWKNCAICHKSLESVNGIFHMNEGICRCEDCNPKGLSLAYAMKLPVKTLQLLLKVQHDAPENWDINTLDFAQKQTCLKAIDGFVQFHLGITWEEGRFRRN